MKAAFIIDSTASLPDDLSARENVFQVDLTMRFPDGKEFADTAEPQAAQAFYDYLEASPELPKSSQPEPLAFYQRAQEIIAAGYDTVFAIFLSGQISGTLRTARMVLDEFADQFKTYYIDSKGTSYQMQHILIEGLDMVESAWPANRLAEELQWIGDNSRVYVMIQDLDTFVKGGRASSLTAKLGSLLRINVVAYFNAAGEVVLYDKLRTKKKVIQAYQDLVDEALATYPQGIRLAFAHGGVPEEAEEFKAAIHGQHPELDCMIGYLTPVLGTHGGKGSIGMGTLAKHRPLTD
ncbi:DegV family protein [Aerococcus sp. UMB9870]|uniref:DegV family protein n=1 Tax=Aerococcus sp. UMB9870 TaxID=3046351 RepID=UPI00254D0904|nr:DegV family protein [Aerococcus sp. UMB9870]MDK6369433.1 DegV family protein [Aerococcus sp. UMB9870]